MGLSKEQYDHIMRGYQERQTQNYHELNRRRRRIYTLIPEYQQLEEAGFVKITKAYSMEDAVDKARKLAVSGGNVLLSPACASFDMFEDYEARGRIFKEIVNELN